jgi:hypothetical protein
VHVKLFGFPGGLLGDLPRRRITAKTHSKVAHAKTHFWGPSLMTYKEYAGKSDEWQVTCPLTYRHKHTFKKQQCRKSITIKTSDPNGEAVALNRCRHWANRCVDFAARSAHAKYNALARDVPDVVELVRKRLPEDFADPPPSGAAEPRPRHRLYCDTHGYYAPCNANRCCEHLFYNHCTVQSLFEFCNG